MFKLNRGAGGAAVAVALALSACTGGAATPSAGPSTPGAQTTVSNGPFSETPSTPTPAPTPSAQPSGKVGPVATPTPSEAPTATASATPTSVAWQCTGTADHQAFFAEAAGQVSFDVYCAVLPDGWYLEDAAYELDKGGKLTVDYKGPDGASLAVSEGAFCVTGAADCSPHTSIKGTAAFGDKPGMLDILTTPPDVYVVYVDPGTTRAYQISGSNLTQAKFVALAAALIRVPKS